MATADEDRKARIMEMKEKRERRARTSVAWSEKKAAKEHKAEKREKRGKKKEWLRKVREGEIVPGDADKSKSAGGGSTKDAGSEDDWDELAREERAAKRVKRTESGGAAGNGPVVGSFEGL